MTQTERLHQAMKRQWITALDAQQKHGCMRLAARVKDLRDAGHQIDARWVETRNRFGDAVRVKAYRAR